MIPIIRPGQTIRVTAPSDTGTPKTVYVVGLYGMEQEAATLKRIYQRRQALLADGIAEGDARMAEATQGVVCEALAAIIVTVENEQGPDGKMRTITERTDILAHLAGLPKRWFEEVADAIAQPAAVSEVMGKD